MDVGAAGMDVEEMVEGEKQEEIVLWGVGGRGGRRNPESPPKRHIIPAHPINNTERKVIIVPLLQISYRGAQRLNSVPNIMERVGDRASW